MAEHLSMVAFTTNRKRQVCYSPWEYSSPATINNSNFSKKIRWWGKAQQGSEESQVVCWWSQETLPTLLLLLSRFSRVQLCATPQTAAHQAPLSLGFSRQEHWSGLPFPSPMHESEKWKVKVKSLSRVRLLVTLRTAAHQAPPSMEFSRQEYWSGVPLPSPVRPNTSPLRVMCNIKFGTDIKMSAHI